MKTIPFLGSTSEIGAALCEQFARGNKIIISGRKQHRLSKIRDICISLGAHDVKVVPLDLSYSLQPIFDANSDWPIDLVVDVASSTSQNRDSDASPGKLLEIVQTDLITHLSIFQKLMQINNRHPDVIFISSVLAIVGTPDREIYSAMKRLMEIYFQKIIETEQNVNILIFRIGKLIDPKKRTISTTFMAHQIKHLFETGHKKVTYGISGKLLISINAIHPAVVKFLINRHRSLRQFISFMRNRDSGKKNV